MKNIINRIKTFDYIKLLNTIKKDIKIFYDNNKLFIVYILVALLSCMLLRNYTIDSFLKFKPTFFDFSVLFIIGSFSLLFEKKGQKIYLLIIMLLITIMNVVHTIYYSFFTSFASFELLETAGQAATQGGAIFEKLRLFHFVYVLLLIVYIVLYYLLKHYNLLEHKRSKRGFFVTLAIGVCLLLINIISLSKTDLSRLAKQWNREYIVDRYGIIVYNFNDLVQTLSTNYSSLFKYDEAASEFRDYYSTHYEKPKKNEYTNIYEGYNVITVHMESIMQFLINKKINGEEITPNINKLIGESLYFDNFYAQVSVGTSSDTEFTVNTGLLPVQSGTVFVSYYNRKYVTLENLLADKGYYTFSMHANKSSMWNRNKMHPSLGYKDLLFQESYQYNEETDRVGLGLNDSSFFTQSETMITDINSMIMNSTEYTNYMGTMITLSNHTPFNIEDYMDNETLFDVRWHTGNLDENGTEIVLNYLEGTTIGDYIKSAHYADQCLGEFIDYVKGHDEYNKTVFVMYGDHPAQLSKSQFEYMSNFNFDEDRKYNSEDEDYVEYDYYSNEMFKKVPLIIWSKDQKAKGTCNYLMGMIDVLPTIGNMLNIESKYALGHDIFSIKDDNVVVFPNGNFITNKVFYYNSKSEYKVFDTLVIDEDYVNNLKDYAEDVLSISNNIIVYDLIAKEGNNIPNFSEIEILE